jgi:hypothetical protein
MASGGFFEWDTELLQIEAAAPESPFLVMVEPNRWQVFRWNPSDSIALSSCPLPGLSMNVTLPSRLGVPGHTAPSLDLLAASIGSPFVESGSHPPRTSSLVAPFGIDGARQHAGVRHAPVLDPGAGVIACSSCFAKGTIEASCPCSPSRHLMTSPCSLCHGSHVLAEPCDACGGAGSFLWPATIRLCRRDGLAGPNGDNEVAIDVDLSSADVSIERALLETGDSLVWEDRWVVDLFRAFHEGCRELGIEWPDAVVWANNTPTIAARVSTAFTLLRIGTPTVRELALQPRLDQWIIREGQASPVEVLDPEHLGLHAASIVARLSRGVVEVTPIPPLEVLLAKCHAYVAPAGLKLAVSLAGDTRVLVALSDTLEPAGVIAHGSSSTEMMVNACHNLGCW